jgi:autotransporter strand-loop-strand O-heptosyltransferase
MFKEIVVHANFNERTGYGVHASRFFPRLEKLVREAKGEKRTVHISLLDVVTASQVTERHPAPSVLFTVWESTEYPEAFMKNLKLYDQLWVPSEWQRAASIAQGIPEGFVKVVPEGVDADIYKPLDEKLNLPGILKSPVFNFVYVGQWQPRKSTEEVCKAFIKAFPNNENVRLYLSADTLFPSDTYKSTEERLVAYGINDPRIIPVHYEEREEYIRRLQNADCFVSCARSEGWGLPIIEAMAVGIPVIVSDWGGSTEYHKGAITVPVKQLIKPFGIYGNWDVPGKWCEPDYDKLVEVMQDVYRNDYKESALKLSEKIRTEFSWDAAAQKGFNVLKELSEKCIQDGPVYEVHPDDPDKAPDITESDIRKYAASHGFKINGLQKEKSIFVVGTWPNSSEKMESLLETLQQIKQLGFPVLISTHYPLPAHIVELADYVLYEKKNVLSDDWRATYARRDANGHLQEKECRIPYHGVACLNAIRNAIDFCHPKFDRMFYIEYDSEVDVDIFVDKVRESSAPFVGVKYEGQGIHTDLWSGELSWLFNNIPVINSWDEYKAGIDERIFKNEYPLEIWLWNRLKNVQRQVAFVDIPITNRFDQVDRELWDDDIFRVHFFDGPYLFIDGLSRREYDVQYKVGDTVIYNVKQKVGMWSKPKIKYYLPWEVTASIDGVEKFRHTIDLKGKRVLIQMASKALGDSIAWIPYVEEFRKKHDCHVLCSGWWQEIFDYPEIEWVKPGSEVKDIYASYQIGCFDDQPDMNPKNWRETPLQKVAADILGLKYEPLRAKLKKFPSTQNGDVRDYICFSEFSTMKNKMWNRPGAWQKVVDKCRSLGYKCISVSAEPTQLNDVIKHNGQPIEKTIEDIRKCTFYIGLNHGPSWIAYALGIPCLMITGVSEEWNDFPNPYRIAINNKVCGVGCFNDPALPIDRGWLWCPRGKNYACTSEITEHMVYEKIHELSVIRRDGHAVKKGEKSGRDKFQHIRNDKGGTPESPSNSGVPEQCGEV